MTREVFIAQVEREQEALRGFLLALCCGNKSDADDLAQDALVKAYLSCSGYQDMGRFRSWLFKIAYNNFLNHKASLRTTESIDEARTLISSHSHPAAQGTLGNYSLLSQRLQHQGDCRHHRDIGRCRQEAALSWTRQTKRKIDFMTKDKALEELFLAQKPKFDDNTDFMARLTRRLDAVEYVKQQQEATIRRYKMAMIVAFVVGIISGAVTIAFVLSTPANVPLFTFSVQNAWLLWLTENSRIIVATALALLISLGIISIISNIQEIMSIRTRLKTPL